MAAAISILSSLWGFQLDGTLGILANTNTPLCTIEWKFIITDEHVNMEGVSQVKEILRSV